MENFTSKYIRSKVIEVIDMNDTLSGLPKLSREYSDGYRKAIQDIIKVFDYTNNDLKFNHMRMNYKWAKKRY